jgi:hypothetical protein
MRKFTFVLMMMLGFTVLLKAQPRIIESFESIKMVAFDMGTGGSVSVVANPDPTGINTSGYVCKMVIGGVGRQPWAGWYGFVKAPINGSVTRYAHIKVWKSVKSHVDFKLESGPGGKGSGDVWPLNHADSSNATVGAWEELVFDFGTFADDYNQITVIPDFKARTDDQTMYVDDIYFNNDATLGSAPVTIIEGYEIKKFDIFANGTTGSVSVVANPDKSGINLSNYVGQIIRAKDGDPWEGVYTDLLVPVTPSDTRYLHVKVWKPIKSHVDFKLEQGDGTPNNTGDIYPLNHADSSNSIVNAWEDLVFDFGAFAGNFKRITLIADFQKPQPADFNIYFDDIRVNNDPNPITKILQTFTIDMGGAALVAGDHVFIAGSFGGFVNGDWKEPGTVPENELFESPAGSGLYSVNLSVDPGSYKFKFFINKGTGWGTGDPQGDRIASVSENTALNFIWHDPEVTVGVRANTLAGKIEMYPNPVRDVLTVNSTADIRKVVITNTLGKVVGNVTYTSNQKINTSNLSRGMYFVTFIGKDGNKVTQKLIKE